MLHDFAWVWWDCDAEAWTVECWACEMLPLRVIPLGFPDSEIRSALQAAAERHNQQRHANCTILSYSWKSLEEDK